MNNEIKHDVVILLCPSESIVKAGKYSYPDLDKDKQTGKDIYLGGEVRMRAAVIAAKSASAVIVVGGSKLKVDGMKGYLEQKLKITPPIIRIESDPDTIGNFRAIARQELDFSDQSVAILTNGYHLPRSLVFARSVYPYFSFIPRSAESYIPTDHYSAYAEEYLLREQREDEGIRVWEKGTYKDQNKPASDWKSICYDMDLLKRLT